jgi:hypothetical protein
MRSLKPFPSRSSKLKSLCLLPLLLNLTLGKPH